MNTSTTIARPDPFGFDPDHIVAMRVEMASDNDTLPADWPCEIVRRAAGLMKERAEGATPGTARQIVEVRDADRFAFKHRVVAFWESENGGEASCAVGDMRLFDAEHIAPWTPVVAVLIAESWQHQADDMADQLAHLHACAGAPGYVVQDEREHMRHDWTATVRAALAYLREDAPAVTS